MKGPRVFALCVAVSVLASVDIGSAIQESGRPNGEAPPARALDAFPESLEVELFLPRAVRRDDMDYLAWISGGDALEQDVGRERMEQALAGAFSAAEDASRDVLVDVAAIGSSRDRASRMLRVELRRSGQVHRAKTSAAA
jgi:hypothetical protein